MKIPKFKPTAWKVMRCVTCNKMVNDIDYYCTIQKHEVIEIDNIPFFIHNMNLSYSRQGWWKLTSDFKEEFPIHASHLSKALLKSELRPGGEINNTWWMWCQIGGRYSIKPLFDE